MVEQEYNLDVIFSSLSDPTRRDILRRVRDENLSVGTIADNYSLSFAGVAKHLEVLEHAGLIHKTRKGKEQIVSIDPVALAAADDYLEDYKRLWERRLDSLDTYLKSISKKG